MIVLFVKNVLMNINIRIRLINVFKAIGKFVKRNSKKFTKNRVKTFVDFHRNYFQFDVFLSVRFDNDREEMTSRAHDLQKLINDKANEMIRTIENQKRNYFELMDKQKKTNKTFVRVSFFSSSTSIENLFDFDVLESIQKI